MEGKKYSGLLIIIVIIVSLFFSLAPTMAPAETIELKCAWMDPPKARDTVLIESFLPKIEKATESRVKVKLYPGGTLLGFMDMFDGLQKGISDIAIVHNGYYSLKNMPFMMIGNLPFIYEGRDGFWRAWTTDNSLSKLMEDYASTRGYDKIKVLNCMYAGMHNWAFRGGSPKLEPKTPEDFKPLKVRVSGHLSKLMKDYFGISSVMISLPEVYEAIQRGTIDGAQSVYATWIGFNYKDVAKWYHKHDYFPISLTFMANKSSLERLSKQDQVIVTDYLEQLSNLFSANSFAKEYSLDQTLMEAGVKKYVPTADVMEKWNRPANDYVKAWMEACGGDWGRRGLEILKKYNQDAPLDWSALGL